MIPGRRQLPAYSPVAPVELVGALFDVLSPRGEEALERLREHLATRCQASDVILTRSGTQALQLAMAEAARPGERGGAKRLVALPAYSCYDIVTAAVGADVQATFYDIDPVTLTPDPESLREVLRQGAGVVVAGNLYGFPLDWDWLRAECRAAGAVLVEDAAQGLGSTWRGQPSGSFGDYSVLSFGRGKGWTAGEGGALLIRETRPKHSISVPSQNGLGGRAWLSLWILWLIGRPALYRLPTMLPGLGLGETRYRAPTEVEQMAPIVAALASRHANRADRAVQTRRGWASRWSTLAQENEDDDRAWTPCTPLDGGTCGYLRYPACVASEDDRMRVLRSGLRHGVAPGYPLPLPMLPESEGIAVGPVEADGAQRLARSLLTLPTHPRVSSADYRALATALS